MQTTKTTIARFTLVLIATFATSISFAQDKTADVSLNVTESSKSWYTQPWMWVVGGAIFVLLLVALLRGGKKSD